MKRPVLLCRREIWLPTVWGWLFLLVLSAITSAVIARHLYGFLATTAPVGAHVLVVEGWLGPEELDEAVTAFRAGGYERVVTTGGPVYHWAAGGATFAEQAATYLRQHGLPAAAVTAVPAARTEQDRTYQSAVAVRNWARSSGADLAAIDVISDSTHARRSRLLYRLAFGDDVQVGVLATRAYEYDAAAWWRSSAGAKRVIEEAVGFVWVACCFRPAPGGA
jgi:DUF218 domain-containing protein